ncbi:MAG: molecular chaperone DnaJ, partial [Pseudomonadota bacterium]|nr:molecular chaperone DnaJ [Pseudomonadota bacterium]
LAVLAPVIMRMFRGFGKVRPSPGQSSDVETEYLKMVLDHDSGEMTGTVLKGDFASRDLDGLGLDQLLDLFETCLAADEKSAQVLEAYLDRSRHTEWRDAMDSRQGGGNRGAPMTAEEARDILGVGADAGDDKIKEAHRELMKQNHPDHGGSTYLAAKINQAKDLLLGT